MASIFNSTILSLAQLSPSLFLNKITLLGHFKGGGLLNGNFTPDTALRAIGSLVKDFHVCKWFFKIPALKPVCTGIMTLSSVGGSLERTELRVTSLEKIELFPRVLDLTSLLVFSKSWLFKFTFKFNGSLEALVGFTLRIEPTEATAPETCKLELLSEQIEFFAGTFSGFLSSEPWESSLKGKAVNASLPSPWRRFPT